MRVALALIAAIAGAQVASAQPAPRPLEGVGVDEKPGAQIPLDLQFSDAGQPVTLARFFDGQTPVILVLAYSACRSLCNQVLHGVALGLRDVPEVPGDDFALVTVSIDPDETASVAAETQAMVLEALHRPGQRRRWRFLTGRRPAIARLADSVGFRYRRDPRTGQLAHPAVVFALTGDGRVSRYLYGVRFAASELTAALTAARAGDIAKARDDIGSAVLSCFHFDPSARKYGKAIQLAFRIGAAVIFAALVILVTSLYRWEKRRERRR